MQITAQLLIGSGDTLSLPHFLFQDRVSKADVFALCRHERSPYVSMPLVQLVTLVVIDEKAGFIIMAVSDFDSHP